MKQKVNIAWSTQTPRREARDKRKVKNRRWFKPRISQPLSSASAVPQELLQEADDEDKDDEDDWGRNCARGADGEGQEMRDRPLEFDVEFIP